MPALEAALAELAEPAKPAEAAVKVEAADTVARAPGAD